MNLQKINRAKLSGLSAESVIKLKLTTSKHNEKNTIVIEPMFAFVKITSEFSKNPFLIF